MMDLAFWCLNKCFGSVFHVESLLYFVIQNHSRILMTAVGAVNITLALQHQRQRIKKQEMLGKVD